MESARRDGADHRRRASPRTRDRASPWPTPASTSRSPISSSAAAARDTRARHRGTRRPRPRRAARTRPTMPRCARAWREVAAPSRASTSGSPTPACSAARRWRDATRADWDDMLRLNFATFLVPARRIGPLMRRQGARLHRRARRRRRAAPVGGLHPLLRRQARRRRATRCSSRATPRAGRARQRHRPRAGPVPCRISPPPRGAREIARTLLQPRGRGARHRRRRDATWRAPTTSPASCCRSTEAAACLNRDGTALPSRLLAAALRQRPAGRRRDRARSRRVSARQSRARDPERNFFAIERSATRTREIAERLADAGVANARVICGRRRLSACSTAAAGDRSPPSTCCFPTPGGSAATTSAASGRSRFVAALRRALAPAAARSS